MVVSKISSLRSTIYIGSILVVFVGTAHGLNLGLIAGDNKRLGSPLTIKKYSRHSPIFINIHPKAPFTPPKLPSKPPPLRLEPLRRHRSILPKLPFLSPVVIPLLPKPLPFLPLLPPIIPPLPLFPLPIIPRRVRLPRIPGMSLFPGLHMLGNPLKPLKVPILPKTRLQKALGSEVKTVTVPCPDVKRKENVLEKLLELKQRGSLTPAEFNRFKKLLLR